MKKPHYTISVRQDGKYNYVALFLSNGAMYMVVPYNKNVLKMKHPSEGRNPLGIAEESLVKQEFKKMIDDAEVVFGDK